MTRTETKAKPDASTATPHPRALCNTSTDCRCGQQLDMSARAHCPRCGRSVARA